MASNLMTTIKESNKKSKLFITERIYSVDGYTAHNSLYKLILFMAQYKHPHNTV